MDYGYPEKRKNKGDKRAKARFGRYKKGGKYRSVEFNKKNEIS